MSGSEGVEREDPKWDGPHSSRAEEVIDWYQHHKAVQVEDLVAEYASKKANPDWGVSVPLQMAFEARREEVEDFLFEEGRDR